MKDCMFEEPGNSKRDICNLRELIMMKIENKVVCAAAHPLDNRSLSRMEQFVLFCRIQNFFRMTTSIK